MLSSLPIDHKYQIQLAVKNRVKNIPSTRPAGKNRIYKLED